MLHENAEHDKRNGDNSGTVANRTEREADGRWIAEVLDLPGVIAYGNTEKEAITAAQATNHVTRIRTALLSQSVSVFGRNDCDLRFFGEGSGAPFVHVSFHLLRRPDDDVIGRIASESVWTLRWATLDCKANFSYGSRRDFRNFGAWKDSA